MCTFTSIRGKNQNNKKKKNRPVTDAPSGIRENESEHTVARLVTCHNGPIGCINNALILSDQNKEMCLTDPPKKKNPIRLHEVISG